MKFLLPFLATACLAVAPVQAADFNTGYVDLKIKDRASGRTLKGYIMYPTMDNGGRREVLGNKVWKKIEVQKWAKAVVGQHPLVVISHGMFGHVGNQAWLADRLAQEGYVVAAINHPGTSHFSMDPNQRRELWERPRDITRVIDHMLNDPETEEFINPGRIYVAGHSLGGLTTLWVAGARYDGAKITEHCAKALDHDVCHIIDDWRIAKTPEDLAMMEQDLSDPRVRAFVSLDIGGTQMLSPQSLGASPAPFWPLVPLWMILSRPSTST